MIKRIKNNIPIILFIVAFLIGLLVMLYPSISSEINKSKYSDVIISYDKMTGEFNDSKNDELLEKARAYNDSLSDVSVEDAFSNPDKKESKSYLSILNVNGDGVMGYISIPKIDVKVPIYHGTSAQILQKGVGHLEGSSFPIGGDSTHSILSAHRGLPSARLFTDLDQLEVGDMFYIYILDDIYAYKVNQVLVVEPSFVDFLRIQEGKDYVTLVTCTPYAVNTHRLLVRGSRVEYSSDTLNKIKVTKKASFSDYIFYIGLFLVFVIMTSGIIIVINIKKKRLNNSEHNNIEKIEILEEDDDIEIL